MSREYAQVWPAFWTGETGRALRELAEQGDADTQRVAFYLMTCGSGTFSGLFYLPLPLLLHELGGLSLQGAHKALASLSVLNFAHYAPPSAQVWLVNAASFNIGERPSLRDNRVIGLQRELESQRKSPFYAAFIAHYAHLFPSPAEHPQARPSQAPPKPLRSASQGDGVSGALTRSGARARSRAGENARVRAAPAPTKLRPTPLEHETPDDVTLTPQHLGALFDQRWRALGHAAPPLPAEPLAELAARVLATAADRAEQPAALFDRALATWGAAERNERELRGPVECFARDFGQVVASIAPPALSTADQLRMASADALKHGDDARYAELQAELRAMNGGGRAAAR